MYQVDVYLRVRKAVGESAPPAQAGALHRRHRPDPGVGPERSDLSVPRKQRHTAQRIFQRLRDEYGFGGQHTIVKDYVREHRRQAREMFVPLPHSPGHASATSEKRWR